MRTGETDPIIAEVRANRNSYAKSLNYDVGEIFRDLRRTYAVRNSGPEDDMWSPETPSSEIDIMETQSHLPADYKSRYASCMEEIKRRTLVVKDFLNGSTNARFLLTTVECISLQIRIILELIALASMVANLEEYKKHRKSFQSDWNGKRILADLEKANPSFYPYPTEQVIDPQSGRVLETRNIDSGFLTKEDFVRLYDDCSKMLHAENPFATNQQDVRAFLKKLPEWMDKIIRLLNHHQIQLIDSDIQVWVVMEPLPDKKVQVCEFRRGESSQETTKRQ